LYMKKFVRIGVSSRNTPKEVLKKLLLCEDRIFDIKQVLKTEVKP